MLLILQLTLVDHIVKFVFRVADLRKESNISNIREERLTVNFARKTND